MKILVVDDDEVMRKLVGEVLDREGYQVQLAQSGEEALALLKKQNYAIILSDVRMVELNGFEVLRYAKENARDSVVILMTGFGSLEGALEAIKDGAFDYVSKPFKMNELKSVVARAAKHWEGMKASLRGSSSGKPLDLHTPTMIGKSPKIIEAYKTLARAAISKSAVFISGESGTGKELAARTIHYNSPHRDKPFVVASCTEAERFEEHLAEAAGGTIFLDEISDLTPPCQLRLLRAIQNSEAKSIEVRLISASRRDGEDLVKNGKIKDDLFYKLNVITLALPPLRDRIEDIPELVGYFLERYAVKNKKAVSHLSEEAMQLLKNYSWPGNIRELEHAIERAVAMTSIAVLYPEDFPDINIDKPIHNQAPASSSLEQLERDHIVRVLEDVGFNKSKASEVLGIDRATLYRKAQRYGIALKGKD